MSYVVEPNPSARGTSSKFHYPSHRVRFDIQRALDASTEDFVARINAAAERDDDADPIDPRIKTGFWVIGSVIAAHYTKTSGTARQLNWPIVVL